MSKTMQNTTRSYLAGKFKIPDADVLWYNSGCSYDRIVVRTKKSALAVAKAVKGQTVNGGWFHGAALGRIEPTTYDGKRAYDVTC